MESENKGENMEEVELGTAVLAPPSIAPSIKSMGSAVEGKTGKVGGGFVPLVMVVGFHHARGPEVENWFGVEEGVDPSVTYEWPLLPFMALSDGAHASEEDFSYFTLLMPTPPGQSTPPTSLFGISCTRQLDASLLINRPADVTRSTVQKAVVVIADSPQRFGMLRERLGVVTSAWFMQKEFSDTEILRRFQESLAEEKRRGEGEGEEDREEYLGMSLRVLVREFRWQTLVLFKCCLLQPKMLFFGSRCEKLCMMQFSLISLIPGLIRNLQDCADPELNSYEKGLSKPTSCKTSDRSSLLSYMGLPLQIFGKGSLFGPYTPLQQLDILADYGTKSYIVGSTNSLLLQQKDRYSDILINLDNNTLNITSSSLRSALALSPADRRWIDFITQSVNDTWDETNPNRPKTMGYVGSEEFIRLQFEEYLLSLISSVKCHNYLIHNAHNPKAQLPHVEGDPSYDFNSDWVEAWSRSENYRIWDGNTDTHLFDIVEPKHPCAGGLTIDDVQKRIAEQVKEFHLDERFAVGKEVLGRNLAAGKEKANTVFNKIYADMETFRENQRRKHEEQVRNGGVSPGYPHGRGEGDGHGAKVIVQSVGSKAGAYIGSWGTWMGEKKKGWGKGASAGPTATGEKSPSLRKENIPSSATTTKGGYAAVEEKRPGTGDSYGESIFDAESVGSSAGGGEIGTKQISSPLTSPHTSISTATTATSGFVKGHVSRPSRFHEVLENGEVVRAKDVTAGPVVRKEVESQQQQHRRSFVERSKIKEIVRRKEISTDHLAQSAVIGNVGDEDDDNDDEREVTAKKVEEGKDKDEVEKEAEGVSKVWEEGKIEVNEADKEERSRAVAEAVAEASKTPISP